MLPRLSRSALSLLVAAALAANGLVAPLSWAAATPRSFQVKAGAAKAFSRIELHGAHPTGVSRDGADLVLRFARTDAPDITRLHVDPPPYLKAAAAKVVGGGVELRLTATDGALVKTGWDDGVFWINLAPPPKPDDKPAALAARPSAPARPDPSPASGVVKMQAELRDATLLLHFPWRGPAPAAVFRRGAVVWVVFASRARLDVTSAPSGLLQARRFAATQGPGYAALRITAPAAMRAVAWQEGDVWTLALGARPPAAPAGTEEAKSVSLEREGDGSAGLVAKMAGATDVFWIDDPVVGDKLAVVTALPPAKGVSEPRGFVGLDALQTAQGLALAVGADGLTVRPDGDLVHIGRPQGLALSPSQALRPMATAAPMDLPAASSLPALIDFTAWSKTGEGGFWARYNALLDRAAAETAKGKDAPLAARLGLARFLVGSELSFEAIGVLNSLLKAEPTLAADAEFRGLRGAARAMAGRWKDAEADFSVPAVAADPASALWRGYVLAQTGDMAGARREFVHGRSALAQFEPKWRARFVRADAQSALEVGDASAADLVLHLAGEGRLQPDDEAGLTLVRAQVLEAGGKLDQALDLYERAARSDYGAVSAPALLAATRIRLARGKLSTSDAVAALDSLRFRWRGDATEIETIRELGRIDIAQGRYREALEALRSAGSRRSDLAASAALQKDLSDAFKGLFLEGRVDGMEPVQALALFYDFKELTPIGADGDLMVRRLVKRLVDADLLDQASVLLKYQVDNRLDGVAKAQVASDLAGIDLLAGRPEDALGAINSSRSTLLPTALNAQRRLIQARALVALGRYDHALELLENDASPDATEIRGAVAWRSHDWAAAGRYAEARLGDRWKAKAPLDGGDAALLIRAGTSYSLAQDDAALARLRSRYTPLVDAAPQAAALKVALAGVGGDGVVPPRDFGRAVADADLFAGWVGRMKAHLADATPMPSPVKTPAAASGRDVGRARQG